MIRHLSLLPLLALFSAWAIAAPAPTPATEGETKMKVEETKAKNKVDGDIDQEITNAKLRADSGSKSKFSMSAQFGYTGGAIDKPFAADRPNLAGTPETPVETSITGTLKTRYRPSKNKSFTLGVSMGLQTPFAGRVNTQNKQFNTGDPIIGYNYTFPAFGLQHSLDPSASFATSNESLAVDQTGSLAIAYATMKAFPNGVSVGISSTAYQNFYSNKPGENKDTRIRNGGNRVDRRTAWAVTLSPVVEYKFNDTFSFRTLFGWFRWRHLYGESHNLSLYRTNPYQSVGLGIVVARDVYLYPNVQFLIEDTRAEFTNVGLSSSINVF